MLSFDFCLFFPVALLCTLFVFLSIFLALAIPSPTCACHRRSGGSSLISGAAKNRESRNERERERETLLLLMGRKQRVCGSTACLANWSHASLCLNSGIRGLICIIALIPVLRRGASTCPVHLWSMVPLVLEQQITSVRKCQLFLLQLV